MKNKVVSIVFSDNSVEAAIFTNVGILSILDLSGTEKKSFAIKNVKSNYTTEWNYQSYDKGIRLYFHSPYVCVSERFGINAAIINIVSGEITELSREDYQSDVSSYSIGFLDYKDKILLLHQTQWNRLDITDLSTNEILTKRTIRCEIADWVMDEKYKVKVPLYDNENSLDFFHSLITVAPNGLHFLSSGWLWHPVGEILAFKSADFLENYELCNKRLLYWKNDNWDTPCTFIDSTHFIVATEGQKHWKDPEKGKAHKSLWFFNAEDFNGEMVYPYYADRYIAPYKKIKCDIFKRADREGIVGELYYDAKKDQLIAISENGAYILTLEGKITAEFPEMKLPKRKAGFISDNCDIWRYNPFNRVFYRYNQEKENIEQISID